MRQWGCNTCSGGSAHPKRSVATHAPDSSVCSEFLSASDSLRCQKQRGSTPVPPGGASLSLWRRSGITDSQHFDIYAFQRLGAYDCAAAVALVCLWMPAASRGLLVPQLPCEFSCRVSVTGGLVEYFAGLSQRQSERVGQKTRGVLGFAVDLSRVGL